MELKKLITFLDEYLDTASIKDKSLNGLQVEGNSTVNKIGFCVDISKKAINESIKQDMDLLIVHHGLFWGEPLTITGYHKERLTLLLDNDISLYASHLPLDGHPKIGNNIQIANKLNLKNIKSFGNYNGTDIAYYGELHEPTDIKGLKTMLHHFFDKVFIIEANNNIKKLGVVSGRGTGSFHECLELGIDTFITGEQNHDVFHTAVENNINVVYAGHYSTEIFGLLALKELLEKKFKHLEYQFIDIPTGL